MRCRTTTAVRYATLVSGRYLFPLTLNTLPGGLLSSEEPYSTKIPDGPGIRSDSSAGLPHPPARPVEVWINPLETRATERLAAVSLTARDSGS